jgi:hypothetical protein
MYEKIRSDSGNYKVKHILVFGLLKKNGIFI